MQVLDQISAIGAAIFTSPAKLSTSNAISFDSYLPLHHSVDYLYGEPVYEFSLPPTHLLLQDQVPLAHQPRSGIQLKL